MNVKVQVPRNVRQALNRITNPDSYAMTVAQFVREMDSGTVPAVVDVPRDVLAWAKAVEANELVRPQPQRTCRHAAAEFILSLCKQPAPKWQCEKDDRCNDRWVLELLGDARRATIYQIHRANAMWWLTPSGDEFEIGRLHEAKQAAEKWLGIGDTP